MSEHRFDTDGFCMVHGLACPSQPQAEPSAEMLEKEAEATAYTIAQLLLSRPNLASPLIQECVLRVQLALSKVAASARASAEKERPVYHGGYIEYDGEKWWSEGAMKGAEHATTIAEANTRLANTLREAAELDADHDWALWFEKWCATVDTMSSLSTKLHDQVAEITRQRDEALSRASLWETTSECYAAVTVRALKILDAKTADIEEAAAGIVSERDALRASVLESIRQVGEYRARAEDLAEKQSARLEEARMDGVASVISVRCLKHFKIAPLNANEINGGECGACIAAESSALAQKAQEMALVLRRADGLLDCFATVRNGLGAKCSADNRCPACLVHDDIEAALRALPSAPPADSTVKFLKEVFDPAEKACGAFLESEVAVDTCIHCGWTEADHVPAPPANEEK